MLSALLDTMDVQVLKIQESWSGFRLEITFSRLPNVRGANILYFWCDSSFINKDTIQLLPTLKQFITNFYRTYEHMFDK